MNTRNVGLALAFTTALISGVSIFLNAYAVREFGNASLYTTAKNLVAAAILLMFLVAATRSRSLAREGITRPRNAMQWLGLGLIGVVGGSLPFVLFFEGLARASSTQAAFIQKTLVVWVAILAIAFLRERFGVGHAVAIALLMAGQIATQTGIANLRIGAGELMVFAATLLWAVELVIAKSLLRSLSALTVGVARMAIGVIVLLAYGALSGLFAGLGAIGPQQWAWALVTGIILAAYVATWYSALARAQAVDVTAVLVFGAVVTAALDAGVRGVTPAPLVPGLALITAGTLAIAALALSRGAPRAATVTQRG